MDHGEKSKVFLVSMFSSLGIESLKNVNTVTSYVLQTTIGILTIVYLIYKIRTINKQNKN